jgi:hypothetical protein
MGNTNIRPLFDQSQDDFIYCEICEERHVNNSWCQAPCSEEEYDLWIGRN